MNRIGGISFSALLSFALVLVLGACEVTERAMDNANTGEKLTVEQLAAQHNTQRGGVQKLNRPYYGSKIPAKSGSRQGDSFPTQLEGAHSITIRLQEQSDISQIATVITQVTGIPVNIRTRYVLSDGSTATIPVVTRMHVDYEGPLSRLMDRIGTRMDVAWNYKNDTITIDRMVTRDYHVPLPVATTTFENKFGGETGGNDSATATLATNIAENTPWDDLENRLSVLVPAPGQLVIQKSSGRVSVFAPPSVHERVEKVIDDIEMIYGQRVGLEIGVYFLDSRKAENFGSSLGFIIGRNIARAGSAIVIDNNARVGLTDGISSINLETLASDSSVVDFQLASTIAQSGQITPISINRHITYIKSLETETEESGDGQNRSTGTVTIEPGEAQDGLIINALPRIINGDRIQLFLSILHQYLILESDGSIKRLEASPGNFIGAPEFDRRVIQNQSILLSGETLVLSGYERNLSTANQRGIGPLKIIGLGGRKSGGINKIRMVVLVRPTLIPLGENR